MPSRFAVHLLKLGRRPASASVSVTAETEAEAEVIARLQTPPGYIVLRVEPKIDWHGRRITLPIPPSFNRYWRKTRRGDRFILTDEAKAYKDGVGFALNHAGIWPTAHDLVLTGWVFRQRRAGDLDGFVKCLLDALQGFAYLNDKQLVGLHLYRDDDKHDPRVEIVLEPGDVPPAPRPTPQTLTFPYPPSANHLWRVNPAAVKITKDGRRVQGVVYKTPEARQFMADAAEVLDRAHIQPRTGPVALDVRLFRQRKAGDVDGPLKALLDSMNERAYVDDSQIVEIHVWRYDDPAWPRVEVELLDPA